MESKPDSRFNLFVESEEFSLNFEELEPELFHESKETPTPVATCNVQTTLHLAQRDHERGVGP